ncbi:hypothetical protein LOK49_LG09G01232 [Camellia lanceoleosa]|uniref:Uncharacterized protein n=1 Tax=Camellia lanceoleosa TaxID=1840588 RepID=A0ACC0GJ91_9ERIC|nr:hypothetical protein LOK49_LG09G01232 [Camellia lanceoleosa]
MMTASVGGSLSLSWWVALSPSPSVLHSIAVQICRCSIIMYNQIFNHKGETLMMIKKFKFYKFFFVIIGYR